LLARHLDLLFARTLPPAASSKNDTYKAAISLAAGLIFVASLLLAGQRIPSPKISSTATALGLEVAPPVSSQHHVDLPPDEPAQNYALIPTGVSSVRDLRVAMANDSALEWHFANFNLQHAVLRVLVRDERAYVSYRKDGQILWTRHTVTVHKGEFVLDDGARQVRARCGNRIAPILAETPPPLIAQLGPPPAEFPGPPPEVPGTPLIPPTQTYLPPAPPPPAPCCGFPIVPIIYIPPGGGGPPPTLPVPPPVRVPEPPAIVIMAGAALAAILLRKLLLKQTSAASHNRS
jgi:hypothetical protein